MYKISIILPVFNVEDCLNLAFESILNQTIGFENLEVIFIDDCSTDNSKLIIENLVDKYDNVKGFYLEENSGYAGKPRNIGIENATANYLMFLDPDDIFLENSCEILYNEIIKGDIDLVSGNYFICGEEKTLLNWNDFNVTEERIEIKEICENKNLMNIYPSVWAKIYRKDFLLKNKIVFLEKLPAEDLFFNYHALIKAKNIIFINKSIVNYIVRSNEGNESVTNSRSKNNLYDYLKAYKLSFNLLNDYCEEYVKFPLNHLNFWTHTFILSGLNYRDKIDLLSAADFLYNEFKKAKLRISPKFQPFFNYVIRKDYISAIKLSDEMYKCILEEKNNYNNLYIKDRTIFLLFFGFDVEIGGLAKATFNQANLLSENGYNVKILNVEYAIEPFNILSKFKNFDYIEKNFRKLGYINDEVEFINAFRYYAKKNTFNDKIKYPLPNLKKYNKLSENIFYDENHIIEKTITEDNITKLIYYEINSFNVEEISDFNNFKKSKDKILIKEEKYIDNYLAVKSIYEKNKVISDYLYTKDGFNYMIINKKTKNTVKSILKDRTNNYDLEFKTLNQFYIYFTNEICLTCDLKPFLVEETSGIATNIKDVNPKIAYKIALFHSNFYKKPYTYGSKVREFSALKYLNDLNATIFLTEAQRKDFERKYRFGDSFTIPNFIKKEELNEDYYNTKENFNKNKISIFSRISSEKNLSDAINAFKIVHDKKSDTFLEIFGRSVGSSEVKEKEKLRKLVKKLELEDSVKFKGHINNVNKEMNSSICTLMTSDIEGIGLVLLESMANCTPVICYDFNYGPRDVITNHEDGIIIEKDNVEKLAESIIWILDNPKKAKTMSIKARKKIENNFSSDVNLLKWENVLRHVIINENRKNLLKEYNIKEDNRKLRAKNRKLHKKNKKILNSNSWKITRPLRKIRNLRK